MGSRTEGGNTMTKEKMREIAECYGMRFMRHRGIIGVELDRLEQFGYETEEDDW